MAAVEIGSSTDSATLKYTNQRKLVRDSSGYYYAIWANQDTEIFLVKSATATGFTGAETPVEIVGNVGKALVDNGDVPSIVIDGSDILHLVFRRREELEVWYVQWDTSTDMTNANNWKEADGSTVGAERLCTNNFGNADRPSIDVDSNDYPHVAWDQDDGGTLELFYRRWTGAAWSAADTQITNGSAQTSAFPCLVIDGNDHVHVVWLYYEADRSIRYAHTHDFTNWFQSDDVSAITTGASGEEIIDKAGKDVQYPSMAISEHAGTLNDIWVVTEEKTDDKVMYAWYDKSAGTWTLDQDLETLEYCHDPVFAIDDSGYVYVLYERDENIRYRQYTNAWQKSRYVENEANTLKQPHFDKNFSGNLGYIYWDSDDGKIYFNTLEIPDPDLGGWSNSKKHTINGSVGGAQTDYPMKVNAHYENNLQISTRGIWCWFSDPRAIRYVGAHDKTYIGYTDDSGNVWIASYNHTTGEIIRVIIDTFDEVDDHDNPSILIRNDGKIMIFYSMHTQETAVYCKISTNAEDISTWNDHSIVGSGNVCYPQAVELSGEANKIYLFYRNRVAVGKDQEVYVTSVNGGVNYGAEKVLADFGNNHGAYVKIESNNNDKIFFCFTDFNKLALTLHDIMFCYYDGGSFYKADGTLITNEAGLPMAAADLDLVYDTEGGGNHQSWIWDIALDGSENPIIVFAVFVTNIDHRYRYAIWSGAAWNDYEIVSAGTNLYAGQPHYSGGISLDHDDINTVFLSKEVAGKWQIKEYNTVDDGANWSFVKNLSSAETKNCRPVVIRNHTSDFKVLWWRGRYTSYSDYKTSLNCDKTASDSGEDAILNENCRTDFGDLRFVASDRVTLLDYWIEDKIDGDYAILWVEIDSIPADPNTTDIFLYYGKADAESISSGKDTFSEFINLLVQWDEFTDATGGSLARETTIQKRDSSYPVKFTQDSAVDAGWWRSLWLQQQAGKFFFECDMRPDVANKRIYCMLSEDTRTFVVAKFGSYIRFQEDSHLKYYIVAWNNILTYRADIWYKIGFCVDLAGDVYDILVNDIEKNSGVDFYGNNALANLEQLAIGGSPAFSGAIGYLSDARLRKYVDPEPTHGTWAGVSLRPIVISII